MIPCLVSSLLAALDFYLRTMSAFSALGQTQVAFRDQHESRLVERWGAYARVWESLFQSAQDALLLVGVVLREMENYYDWRMVSDAAVRDLIGNLLGARDRFENAHRNYRSALRACQQAKLVFEGDRSQANYRARESADTSRGTWYRELHRTFSEYEAVLKRLDTMRDRAIAESQRLS